MSATTHATKPTRLAVILGWIGLALALASAIPLGANRPVSWVVLGGAVLVPFVLQTAFAWRRPDGGAWLAAAGFLYLGVLAWLGLQLLPVWSAPATHPVWSLVQEGGPISADPISGAHIILRLATYSMIFWLVLQASSDPEQAMRMMMAVAVASALIAGFGLVAWFVGTNPVTGAERSTVVTGTFVNRNHFATFAVFGLLANLGAYAHLAARGRRGDRRELRDALESFFSGAWVFGLGVLICLSAILLSQSRGGAVAAVAGVFCFLGLYGRRGSSRLALAAVAALMAFAFVSLSSGTLSRLFLTDGEEGRLMIFPAVIDAIADRPWIGHGAGAFHEAFRPYKPQTFAAVEVDFAHSSYLEAAFEYGLPAAIAFYSALLIVVLAIAMKGMARRRYRSLPIVAAAASAAAAVHAMVDFSLQIPANAALFAALLGIGWAQAFRPRSGKRREDA